MQANQRKRRAVVFDALESREVLSGVATPAAEIQSVKIHPFFQGTVKGAFQSVFDQATLSQNFVLAGKTRLGTLGAATLVGSFQQVFVHGPTGFVENGTATLATRQGPVTLTFQGSSISMRGKETVNIAGTAKANFGSLGQFAGAFTAKGRFTFLTPQLPSGTFTLALKARLTPA